MNGEKMKTRIFPFLVLVLIMSMILTFAGCNDEGVRHSLNISNLTVSPEIVNIGSVTNISVVVTNPDSISRTYNATCYVDGLIIGRKIVNLAAKSNQTVVFNYTPTKEGTFNVTIDNLSAIFGSGYVEDHWDIQYNVVNGSKITLNYSLGNTTAIRKDLNLTRGDGLVTLRVYNAVINGTRELFLLSSGWQLTPIFVSNMLPDSDMRLVISLAYDTKGVLYVQDGVGDVDVSSVSSLGGNQTQVNTYGDGKKDAAGSLLINATLEGHAYIVQTGKTVDLPLRLTFTTGNITNIVSIPSIKFNGAAISSNGTPFARDGALKFADYVGTVGTITTTGTGDCLGLTFGNSTIDLQIEIKLVLEPASVE
jgi:hypothetical protein